MSMQTLTENPPLKASKRAKRKKHVKAEAKQSFKLLVALSATLPEHLQYQQHYAGCYEDRSHRNLTLEVKFE